MLAKLSKNAVLAIYALLILVPMLVVFLGTFKTTPELFASPFGLPSSLDVGNFSQAVESQDMGVAFFNSAIVTVAAVGITLFLGTMTAFAIARIPGWKGWAIYGTFVLGMSVPAQANMIPQYVLFGQLDLLDSRLGLVLVNVVATLPVAVFILGGFMKTLPKDVFEATLIDGAGPIRTYASVALPLSMPSIAATAIFLFVMTWNDLLYPLLFIQSSDKRTIPLALLSFQGEFQTNYPLLFAGVVLASVPILLLYVFLQRYFVAGMTAGAVKG